MRAMACSKENKKAQTAVNLYAKECNCPALCDIVVILVYPTRVLNKFCIQSQVV